MNKINKFWFYVLSFTWGLPMSLVGIIVCASLMIVGYKPKKYHHSYYIEIGEGWGGLELGWFFLVGKDSPTSLKNHELGHTYQNACMFGWLTPILWVISATRYQLKRLGANFDYYSWWFEAQASTIGESILGGNDGES